MHVIIALLCFAILLSVSPTARLLTMLVVFVGVLAYVLHCNEGTNSIPIATPVHAAETNERTKPCQIQKGLCLNVRPSIEDQVDRRRNGHATSVPSYVIPIHHYSEPFRDSSITSYIPVLVGGDACGIGLVQGLNLFGDGFLAVRNGPSSQFNQIDSLFNGMQIHVCRELGNWLAVVYNPTGQWSEFCGVSHPWPTVLPYTGPCRSGWVYRQWVAPPG
jgi:hypothetical protein